MRFNRGFPNISLGRELVCAALALAIAAWTGGGSADAAKLTTLYNFCAQGGANCTDGSFGSIGLVADGSGNLYSSTQSGGAFGQGVVFKLSPPARGQTEWTYQVLHDFCAQGGTQCSDGAMPLGQSPVIDAAGNLYGT